MYFVDNNTGTTEMPALAPSQGTQVKWFTEGDGNKGISHIGQDWLNIIQAELLAILTEGKIKPDKTKLNQLTLAIKTIITANAFSRKNNLKEIQDAGAQAQTNARKALGLGALATKDKLSSTDVGALEKSKNLSDVPDKATARKNIEVYSKTEGDGRYLRKEQNLKDVGDAATARTNLSVYSKSDVYTRTEGDSRYLRKDQNGKDIANKSTFIYNLGLRELGTSGEKIPLLSTANTWTNRQTFSGGLSGELSGNASTAAKLKTARKISNVAFDGSSDITLKASHVGAFALGKTGSTVANDKAVGWNWSSGAYNATISGASTLIIHFYMGEGSCPAVQFRINYKNGGIFYRSARDGYGFEADWSEFYTTTRKPSAGDVGALPLSGGQLNGALGIGTSSALGGNSIVLGDNDTGFKQNGDGNLDVYANNVHVMRFVSGSIQSNKTINITGRVNPSDYGNFDSRYVKDVRLGSRQYYGVNNWQTWNFQCPSGHVLSGINVQDTGSNSADNIAGVYYRPVQKYINGTWYNVASV